MIGYKIVTEKVSHNYDYWYWNIQDQFWSKKENATIFPTLAAAEQERAKMAQANYSNGFSRIIKYSNY